MGKAATEKVRAEQTALKRRTKNRRLLMEVHEEALEFSQNAASPRVDPSDAVQEILDRLVAMYRHATMKVLQLPEEEYWRQAMGGPIQHEWIREQERLGMQIVHVAGKASSMGIAERQIRLQEAQASIFATIAEAAMADLGIPHETRLLVHEKIASGLEDIEGTAQELSSRAITA